MDLLRTPLYETHRSFGAKLVEFAGWDMPVQFTGIIEEHKHTRSACSVFDVSHMGRLKVAGDDAESFLDWICTRNLKDAEVGRCYYTHICREDAGILDDAIVSRFEDHWGMVCNASNRATILDWLHRRQNGRQVDIEDETLATAMVACQGPKTLELAKELTGTDLSGLKRYHFLQRPVGEKAVITYRTGYTGEEGVEVVLPAGLAPFLIPVLLGTPESPHPVIRPAGLGARDTLRLEAGMPLYGHELTTEIDSLSAGQGWCVDLEKDFVGASSLRKIQREGLSRRLVGLELEGRRIARQHATVYCAGRTAGKVTSGTLSPTLGKSIAMAYVDAGIGHDGAAVEVEVGASRAPARVVKLPFYKRMRS